jgi:hypothetical protein
MIAIPARLVPTTASDTSIRSATDAGEVPETRWREVYLERQWAAGELRMTMAAASEIVMMSTGRTWPY